MASKSQSKHFSMHAFFRIPDTITLPNPQALLLFHHPPPPSTTFFQYHAHPGQHIWQPSSSTDLCHVDAEQCCHSGPWMKCVACQINCHVDCISMLTFECRPTFNNSDEKQPSQCQNSYKSPYIQCSWCKTVIQGADSLSPTLRNEQCSMGVHAALIIPPSWFVKDVNAPGDRSNDLRIFHCEPPQFDELTSVRTPLIVFLNPKSGDKRANKLIEQFQWHLNPRQVFDLSQQDPFSVLSMFRNVPNLRIIACGGDGTLGWISSVIYDKGLDANPPPPLAPLPLGTGNDLARVLGWGPGYTGKSISKVLNRITQSQKVNLDRWQVSIEYRPSTRPLNNLYPSVSSPNLSVVDSGDTNDDVDDEEASLDVDQRHPQHHSFLANRSSKTFSNYMSVGADAAAALDFNESRESQTLDVLCDGVDYTQELRKYKAEVVLFLNIPSYAAGTQPWGNPSQSSGFKEQRQDDGLIEVIGLTSGNLALLHVGRNGFRVCQCRRAVLSTQIKLPLQFDGEAGLLPPSRLEIKCNPVKAVMLFGDKPVGGKSQQSKRSSLRPPLRHQQLGGSHNHIMLGGPSSALIDSGGKRERISFRQPLGGGEAGGSQYMGSTPMEGSIDNQIQDRPIRDGVQSQVLLRKDVVLVQRSPPPFDQEY